MDLQQTVATELVISGRALQSGVSVTMRIMPQPVNAGIWFGRSDLPGQPAVKAEIHRVLDTLRSTSIGRDDWRISTIEHLMAAFHGLGIDNALVLVDGAELPNGDGSSLFFVSKILEGGLVTQDKPRNYYTIREPLYVEGVVNKNGEPFKSRLIALPGDTFEVCFTFTSDHPVTGTQYHEFHLNRDRFIQEIAPARTIAFLSEIDYLRSCGLARGGDLDSVVVVGEDGYQNELRFPEEMVRHKILDILGDLYLLGPIKGRIIAIRSGHSLNNVLAKEIWNQKIKVAANILDPSGSCV